MDYKNKFLTVFTVCLKVKIHTLIFQTFTLYCYLFILCLTILSVIKQ